MSGPVPVNTFGGRRHLDDGRRSVLVAAASTIVSFAVVGWIVVTSPGWPEIQRSFLDAEVFWDTLGDAAPFSPASLGAAVDDSGTAVVAWQAHVGSQELSTWAATSVSAGVSWSGRTLVPMYHPGRQSTLHRPHTAQVEDWRQLGRLLRTALLQPNVIAAGTRGGLR